MPTALVYDMVDTYLLKRITDMSQQMIKTKKQHDNANSVLNKSALDWESRS